MKDLPRKVTAFLVGLLELGLIVSVGWLSGTEDGESLWGLVMASVICTAGLSLLIWIPLLTGMGLVTLWLLSLVSALRDAGEMASRQTKGGASSTDGGNAGISRYIERMQGAGMPDEVILERLWRAGWSGEDVRKASRPG